MVEKLSRFIDCYIATETCNFKCKYCYVGQRELFSRKVAHFEHTPEEIVTALSVKRLGGTCLINLCAGGETLITTELIPVIRALLAEGHYVMVVTNGTIKKSFAEIAKFPPNLLEQLFFKFSFHYLELKRLQLLDAFCENVAMMDQAGCSYTIEITPDDDLIPYIDEVKKITEEKFGACCHVTIARDDREYTIGHLSDLPFSEYCATWDVFHSELFEFKKRLFYKTRSEFCYAGEYTLTLDLVSGILKQCYCGKALCNIYDHPEEAIPFRAIGHGCQYFHCYNGHVFQCMGAIPELESPYYAQVRNRVKPCGGEWLKPRMKAFMSQKVSDNNRRYGKAKALTCDLRNSDLILKKHIKKIMHRKEKINL